MSKRNELGYIQKIFENYTIFVESSLKEEHFSDPLARVLFSEIGKTLINGSEFSPRLHLVNLMNDSNRIENLVRFGYQLQVGKVNSVIDFIDGFKIENNKAKTLEEAIKNDFIKDRINKLSIALQEKCNDSTTSSKELLRKASITVDGLLYESEDDVERYSVKDLVAEEIRYQNSDEMDILIPSGISIVDQVAGGVSAPSVNYIVATSKSGKSLGLYNSLLKRLECGQTCLFATIEINTVECYHKILAAYSGFDYKKIKQKQWEVGERDIYLSKVKEFEEKYEDRLFMYYNRGGCSPKDIEIYYRQLEKSGIIIGDIFIDYLAIMTSSNLNMKAQVEVMLSLPKEIRILSQKTNSCVFTAQQLSTQAEAKDIKDITYDDIWFSKTIAHEATNIIVFKRDENKTIYSKFLPSRTAWTTDIYYYPMADLDKCYLGDAIMSTGVVDFN